MKVDRILTYSLNLKKGEKVFVFADDKSKEYCNLLCKKIIDMGAIPFVLWNDVSLNISLINCKNDFIYSNLFAIYENMIDSCDAAIMLDNNIESYDGIDYNDVNNFKNKYYLKIFKKIMNFDRWIYLRYPQKELADLFGLSYDEHVRLLENVSNFDYEKLYKSCIPLKNLLDKTKTIRVIQGTTDVSFSKENINTSICCGKLNLPDGEIYTAPEKYSLNGRICFNVDSYFRSNVYKGISVYVINGKIIDSSCNLNDEFKNILDSDEGSRYFGEFAFGLNPYIDRNYNDNLFNEKMTKTVHFAIGYPHIDTQNNNESLVHWDLIVDMQEDSEVYFDDVLVQKNGVFLNDELSQLNVGSKVKKLAL